MFAVKIFCYKILPPTIKRKILPPVPLIRATSSLIILKQYVRYVGSVDQMIMMWPPHTPVLKHGLQPGDTKLLTHGDLGYTYMLINLLGDMIYPSSSILFNSMFDTVHRLKQTGLNRRGSVNQHSKLINLSLKCFRLILLTFFGWVDSPTI